MGDISSDDDSINEISLDNPGAAPNNTIPERSKNKYTKAYEDFMKWKMTKKHKSFKEKVLLAYFLEMSAKLKCTSLYTLYSMLKSTLMLHHEVDIARYSSLLAFLKRQTIGYTVKKSKTFTPDEINRFMKEAHNNEHLLTKVALIFGIVGGCRRHELYDLQYTDVEVYPTKILVKIYNTVKSTGQNSTYRIFTVTGKYYEICKKYMSLRPEPCKITSFFVQYRSGKCRSHPVGINQFSNLSKSIAKFLELPDPDLYTGQSFRRTSEKIVVNFDEDMLTERETCTSDTMPAPELAFHDVNESTSNNKTESRNRNDTNTTISDGNPNYNECNFQMSYSFPNTFENEDFESVNINIPNTTVSEGYTSDSMDSKSQVWKQIHNSDLNTQRLNVSDYDVQGSSETNTNKVININIPDTSTNTDLPENISALVRFNNCKIRNININYTK